MAAIVTRTRCPAAERVGSARCEGGMFGVKVNVRWEECGEECRRSLGMVRKHSVSMKFILWTHRVNLASNTGVSVHLRKCDKCLQKRFYLAEVIETHQRLGADRSKWSKSTELTEVTWQNKIHLTEQNPLDRINRIHSDPWRTEDTVKFENVIRVTMILKRHRALHSDSQFLFQFFLSVCLSVGLPVCQLSLKLFFQLFPQLRLKLFFQFGKGPDEGHRLEVN